HRLYLPQVCSATRLDYRKPARENPVETDSAPSGLCPDADGETVGRVDGVHRNEPSRSRPILRPVPVRWHSSMSPNRGNPATATRTREARRGDYPDRRRGFQGSRAAGNQDSADPGGQASRLSFRPLADYSRQSSASPRKGGREVQPF